MAPRRCNTYEFYVLCLIFLVALCTFVGYRNYVRIMRGAFSVTFVNAQQT